MHFNLKNLLLLGCFLFTFCSREGEEKRPEDGEATVYTLRACFAEAGVKADVNADGSCSWSAGDRLAVYDELGGSFCEFVTEAGDGVFTFTGAPGKTYQFTKACYPAACVNGNGSITLPAAYTASDVCSSRSFPAQGTVEAGTVELRHLAALLRYTLKGIPATASAIELSSPTVSLSGSFAVEGSSLGDGWVSADGEDMTVHPDVPVKSGDGFPEIHARSGAGKVTISLVPGENEELTFYLPLPVGAYAFTTRIREGETVLFENTTTSVKDIYRAHLVTMRPYKPGFGGGTGTAEKPYLIGTPAHLMALAGTSDPDFLAAYYVQTADIDLDGQLFAPIGSSAHPFSGVYDGGKHAVRNLAVSVTGDEAGFIGCLGGGTVKDLRMESASVAAGGQNAGAFVGLMNGGEVSSCFVDALTTVAAGGRAAGSVAGKVTAGTISGCAAHGNVNAYDCAGGIAGFLNPASGDDVLVINCVYEPVYMGGKLQKATLETANTAAYIGGISGAANASGGKGHVAVVNCYAYPLEMRSTQPAGTTGVWFVGGILGRIYSGPVEVVNCLTPITYSNVLVGGTRINAKTSSSYTSMACVVGQINDDHCTVKRVYSKKAWPYSFRVSGGKTVTASHISQKMGDSNMRGYHNVVYSTSYPVPTGPSGYTEAEGGILAALNAGVDEWNAASPSVQASAWAYDATLGYPKPSGVDEKGPVTRKVSLIGDSISTYEGYIFSTDAAGMGKFYPDTDNYSKFGDAMVLNEQDTWWWRVIYDAMSNARLEVCNAWGGSTTSYFTTDIVNEYGSAQAYARSIENSLQSRNLVYGLGHPDILFCYGGRNDYAYVGGNTNVLLGSYTASSLQAAYDAPAGSLFNNYSQGTVALLKDFHTKNPGAKIVMLLHDMMNDDYAGAAQAITDFLGDKGYNIRFVNFHKAGTTNATNKEIGMTKENGTHPDKAGCANMAAYIVSEIGSWLEE